MREAIPLAKVATRSVAPITRHSVVVSDVVFKITSEEPIEFVDLTDHINQHLKRHGIKSGAVTVFSRHTTAAIKINEAEELLLEDFKQMLRRLCPAGHDYQHNDMRRRKPPISPDERPNGHSHCMHLLLSTSETVPVIDSRLALGTWQRVFMVELDGPREREVIVRCHGYGVHEVTLALKHNGLREHVNGAQRAGYRNGGLD